MHRNIRNLNRIVYLHRFQRIQACHLQADCRVQQCNIPSKQMNFNSSLNLRMTIVNLTFQTLNIPQIYNLTKNDVHNTEN